MLALILSYFLVAYLLVPTAFFRFRPRTILKKFQRSRVEELTFAVEVSLIPVTLSFILAYIVRIAGCHRFAEWADYREIFAASYSEDFFRHAQAQFWSSLGAIADDQLYYVTLACILAYLEGRLFTRLIQNFSK